MKISLIEPLNIDQEIIKQLAQPLIDMGHEFTYYSNIAENEEELYNRCKDSEIVMIANHPLPGDVIQRLNQTKLINIAFTGVDHVDQQAAKDKGILLANASGYSRHAVPELSVGMALELYRQLSQSHLDTLKAESFPGKRMGRELFGKTVGIIGTGQLGINTAKLYKAFGCKLLGFNRSIKDEAIAIGIEYQSLDDVLIQSDIISLHLPLTNETRKIISSEKISLMPNYSILINVARGDLVDNVALAKALNSGKISGAGIDVFESEPPLKSNHPLLTAKNCILTPHIGYLTQEAMIERAKIVFENTLAYIEGHPQNII